MRPYTPDPKEPRYPLFIAKYDFSSEKDDVLNFKKGDLLYIINKDEGDWWFARVKNGGQEGYIPSNYVTKPRTTKSETLNYPLYVAKYDCFLKVDKCLNFKKGDLLYMLDRVEKDWWFAKSKLSGEEGYIPNNYVAEVNTLDAEE